VMSDRAVHGISIVGQCSISESAWTEVILILANMCCPALHSEAFEMLPAC